MKRRSSTLEPSAHVAVVGGQLGHLLRPGLAGGRRIIAGYVVFFILIGTFWFDAFDALIISMVSEPWSQSCGIGKLVKSPDP